jgi:heme a synthase
MATFGSITNGSITKSRSAAGSKLWLQLWLLTMATLVFTMVIVGGATRLTGSGLSITEWQPIMGALPPLSDAAWHEAFLKYQQIPQYKLLNKGMSLDAFKGIFWWEWAHRFLGRFLGVAFLLPFCVFLARGAVKGSLAWKLAGLFVLGGLQGALGWFMVQSGLSQRTDVSQYRLAAHLLLAALLMAALIWVAFDVGPNIERRVRLRTLAAGSKKASGAILALVFVQIGAGALVAGLKAGLAYNTWPLMDGHVIPNGLGAMTPLWINVFENAAAVQFNHRILAYLLALLIVWHGLRVIRSADDEYMRRSAAVLVAAVLAQIGLGVATLVAHVPLHLALTHQAMAMLVLAAAVWHAHTLARG